MNIDNIRLYFHDLDFDITSTPNFSFLAKKRGSHLFFIKYTDFYFIRKLENISLDLIKDMHDTSKIIANKDFTMPKVLRLSVPNINTVFVCTGKIPDDVINYAKKRNKSVVGGQQESIFLLDTLGCNLYCAGKEFTHINGEAKLIWGNKKDFKSLNGHNRSHTLVNDLFQNII